MTTQTQSRPSAPANGTRLNTEYIRSLVDAGKRAGLVRGPGEAVAIEKTGRPVAAEAGLRSQWMDITPTMAKHWLENNFSNRPVKQDVIAAYARDMINGTWVATHQGVAFNDRDELIDGQHRLMAIVKSGCTIRMMVTFGLPSVIAGKEMTTMDCVDRGAPRSVADQLAIQHGMKNASIIAQTARSIAALCSNERTRRLSVGHTLEIYRAFQEAIDHVIARRSAEHGLKQAGVLAGFAFAIMSKWNGKAFAGGAAAICAMYERLVTGEELKDRTAIKHLRAFLTSEEAKLLSRGTDRGVSELVLQAIWLETKGKPIAKLELGTDGADFFRSEQTERFDQIASLFRLLELRA